MRAEQIGELLLHQVVTDRNESELDYRHDGEGAIYFFAQLLRSGCVGKQEVKIEGDRAHLKAVADALEVLDYSAVPPYWRDLVQNGLKVMRLYGQETFTQPIDLRFLSNEPLPPPLEGTARI